MRTSILRNFGFAGGLVALLIGASCSDGASPVDPGPGPANPPGNPPGNPGGPIVTQGCGALPPVTSGAGTASAIASGGEITVQPGQRFQTIVGWEAHGQSGEDDVAQFPAYGDSLLGLAACDLGISRIRLEAQSGLENPTDNYARYKAGQIDNAQWRCLRWTTVNDNADPNSINAAGFHFTQMDRRMERVILPLRQKLASRNERLFINLTYVAFVRQCADIPYIHDNPAEYAEFILATFQHLKTKYGIVPDAVEIILEPDNTPWDGTAIGRAIAATGPLLERNGFRPEFIGPSNTNMTTAVTYFDQMVAALQAAGGNALSYLKEFAYHRYSGVSAYRVGQIAQRAQQYGLRTAMLEKTGADQDELYEDLTVGNVASWQQFALAFNGDGEGGNAYIGVDPTSGRLSYPSRTRYLRQYFKYIRPGAVRIGASSAAGALDPVAFINASGRYVVVVNAAGARGFSVAGLPAGTYGVTYTTDAAFDVTAPDVTLASGQSLRTGIPAAGVLTIYGK